MELIIYNQQETPESINFNHEDLKRELSEKLIHYNSLTYTENEIKDAKSDRAKLNKFKEAIEKRRKEIKAQCLKPLEDFEAKVKEIVAMIDKPILAIDGQIKKFEERTKAEKKFEIEVYYSEAIEDLADLLPLAKFWNEKWLNASVTMKDIKEQINTRINVTSKDLKIITDLNSEFELQIKDTYLRDLNLSLALSEKTRLEDQKAKQEAYDKAQSEKAEKARLEREEKEKADAIAMAQRQHERMLAEEVTVLKEPQVISIATEADGHTLTKEGYENLEKIFAHPEPEVAPEPVRQIDFRVWATTEQLNLLKAFLLENKIKYGRVS